MFDLILGHEPEGRLAHRFGRQHLLVDREDLALDLDFNGSIAGKKQIRSLLIHHQLKQWLRIHRHQWIGGRHTLENLTFFFLDNLQRLSALFGLFHLALAFQFDAQTQLILRVGVAQRILVRNQSRLVEFEQRLIEGLHTHAIRTRHHVLDLGDVALEDQIRDQRRLQHDLHRGDAPGARFARNQALRNQGADIQAQVHEQLLAALLGEKIDDAIECLVRAVGVQRRENQMPRLGELNAVFHGLAVADFADQDDVGRLTQGVLQREVPTLAIDADLAMRDHAPLVRMDVLDRVLDRDDVAAGLFVPIADHRRERRRLAGAGTADQDHEAALREHDILEHGRQFEFLERRDLRIDGAQNRGGAALLDEGAHAESADAGRRDREIALLGRVELLGLPIVHDRAHQTGALLRGQTPVRLRTQFTVDLDRGRKSRRDEQVGTFLFDHAPQQVLHEPYGLFALHQM